MTIALRITTPHLTHTHTTPHIHTHTSPTHRVGESVNGINLDNADHREAVRGVKETKRTLSIVSFVFYHVIFFLTNLITSFI